MRFLISNNNINLIRAISIVIFPPLIIPTSKNFLLISYLHWINLSLLHWLTFKIMICFSTAFFRHSMNQDLLGIFLEPKVSRISPFRFLIFKILAATFLLIPGNIFKKATLSFKSLYKRRIKGHLESPMQPHYS